MSITIDSKLSELPELSADANPNVRALTKMFDVSARIMAMQPARFTKVTKLKKEAQTEAFCEEMVAVMKAAFKTAREAKQSTSDSGKNELQAFLQKHSDFV